MSPEGSKVPTRSLGRSVPTEVLFRRRSVFRDQLELFAQELQANVTKGRAFSCLVTDDEEIRELNRTFRRKNYATDVLSFPSSDVACGTMGDVAISLQRAKEQAHEHGHSTGDELKILLLHGVLHLMGMDHEKDRGEMARTERRWRKKFALRDGLIERAHV